MCLLLFADILLENDGEAADSYLKDMLVLPKLQMCKKRKHTSHPKYSVWQTASFSQSWRQRIKRRLKRADQRNAEGWTWKKGEGEGKIERQKKAGSERAKEETTTRWLQVSEKTGGQEEQEHVNKLFQKMSISELSSNDKEQHHSNSGSEAECPNCEFIYGEDDSLWICCAECSTWFVWLECK